MIVKVNILGYSLHKKVGNACEMLRFESELPNIYFILSAVKRLLSIKLACLTLDGRHPEEKIKSASSSKNQ